MSKVAVIPVRSNSLHFTNIKNKDIRLVGNKSLIRWITETVIHSREFDNIYISTNSDKIFNTLKGLPVKRYVPPEFFVNTKAPILDEMMDMMSNIPRHDIFAYFLPSCIFLHSKYIKEGIAKLSERVDSVVSVSYYSEPIQEACIKHGDSIIPIFDNLAHSLTNNIKQYVKPNGGFYISRWEQLIKNKNFFKGDIQGVLIPKDTMIHIKSPYDFQLAEMLYENIVSKREIDVPIVEGQFDTFEEYMERKKMGEKKGNNY